jgi:hypothetical protein
VTQAQADQDPDRQPGMNSVISADGRHKVLIVGGGSADMLKGRA